MALFAGGIFNNVDPVIGLPLYVWEWIFNLIVIGIMWVTLWWVWWKPYTPLHGLYYAWKDSTAAAFIADKNLIAELVAERQAKCIFDYSKEEYDLDIPYAEVPIIGKITTKLYTWSFYYPTRYLKNLTPFDALRYKIGGVNKDVEIAITLQNGEWDRFPSVICGGVPIDIIIDTDNWTIPNSRQHLAIEKSAREWNKNHKDDQVHSYTKYQRYLIEGDKNGEKIECPPEIKMNFLVPWTRIDIGFPMDLEENDWAGKRRQMAADKARDKDMGDRWKLAVMIILGGCGIAGLILIVRLVTFFLSLPAKG
jgi:hypothetical protein